MIENVSDVWIDRGPIQKESGTLPIGLFLLGNISMKSLPIEPHFCIEKKREFAGVYIFFFLLQNINCGYSLEPPRRDGLNVTKMCKNKKRFFFLQHFIFVNFKNLRILHGHVFVMSSGPK